MLGLSCWSAARDASRPQAMTRWPSAAKDFAAGADPGAGAGDEHRHHERTLRFTPRTAQPSRKMLVDHLPAS